LALYGFAGHPRMYGPKYPLAPMFPRSSVYRMRRCTSVTPEVVADPSGSVTGLRSACSAVYRSTDRWSWATLATTAEALALSAVPLSLGTAIAAMMPIVAITSTSSTSAKPDRGCAAFPDIASQIGLYGPLVRSVRVPGSYAPSAERVARPRSRLSCPETNG